MVRCSICDEHQLSSCEKCGDEFLEGDFIYCGSSGEHNHRDCISLAKGIILKDRKIVSQSKGEKKNE